MISISNAQSVGKRKNQEDYFASRPFGSGYICVVADGMGGLEGGEYASSMSVKTFIDFIQENHLSPNIRELFMDAVNTSNKAINEYIKKHQELKGMGTTFVALLVYEDRILWLSVGDSVLYRYRDGIFKRLNADHSVAGELKEKLDNGEITQEQYDENPDKHMITSALMGDVIQHIDLPSNFLETEINDIYIVASDGIHTLDDNTISKIIANSNEQDIADNIINKISQVNKKYQDNTTILVAKIEQDDINEEEKQQDNIDEVRNEDSVVEEVNQKDNIVVEKKETSKALIYMLILGILFLAIIGIYFSGLLEVSYNSKQINDINTTVDNNKTVKQIVVDKNETNTSVIKEANATIKAKDANSTKSVESTKKTNKKVKTKKTQKGKTKPKKQSNKEPKK